jgi:hypothetical protein
VDTTAFSTHYYKRPHPSPSRGTLLARLVQGVVGWGVHLGGALRCLVLVTCAALAISAHATDAAEVTALRVERGEDGVYLSAALSFELPPAVEEAMLKGVPITFVSEADIYRDRWYWYDKRVATATRSIRVAFQPLTRRWRINVVSGTVASPATGIALTQHFDNLPDALATVRRIARWKIADLADVDAEARHNIDYRFKLDLSQLPRPLQIGVVGQSDWNISAGRNVRPEQRTDTR